MAAEYEGCNEAVKRIVPRVDMDAVDAFIGTAPYLSDLQRAFYKHYIRARYELILAPAFDLVTGLEQRPDSRQGTVTTEHFIMRTLNIRRPFSMQGRDTA